MLNKSAREDLKELVMLIKLNEKYTVLVADGFLPLDRRSSEYHHQRVARIDELSRRYGLI
ncbi:hypothetical protein [Pseudomonas protegens]|uniref:hypothetical protein n=1 Tax=Pseudomonas protegens TaxID=380021 RepID=UPI0011B1E9B0|nr:hypothetical protein [Pseudomonas protegens]